MNDAYAAGFFDGEGCVHIARNIRVILSGCFRPGLLDGFAERWGGRVTRAVWSQSSRRPGVRWEITGLKAAAFLKDVCPYLIEKRDQATLALEYQGLKASLNVRGGKGYSPAEREQFLAIEARIRAMKKPVHDYAL